MEILLTEQLHAKVCLHFYNYCNTKCPMVVCTKLKRVAQCYVTLTSKNSASYI
jgi:hypothetical protein